MLRSYFRLKWPSCRCCPVRRYSPPPPWRFAPGNNIPRILTPFSETYSGDSTPPSNVLSDFVPPFPTRFFLQFLAKPTTRLLGINFGSDSWFGPIVTVGMQDAKYFKLVFATPCNLSGPAQLRVLLSSKHGTAPVPVAVCSVRDKNVLLVVRTHRRAVTTRVIVND